MGGVKLKDNLDYSKKVEYYGKVGKRFSEKVPLPLRGCYLPNGEDNRLGKRQHDRLDDLQGGPALRSKYPTPEKFRDYCFGKAEKDQAIENCNGTADGCTECGRDKRGSND